MPVFRNNRHAANVFPYTRYELVNPAHHLQSGPEVVRSSDSSSDLEAQSPSEGFHTFRKNASRPYKMRKKPDHIPRPRNAFIIFRSTFVATPSVTNGEEQQNELSKNAGKAWAMLTEEEKRPFRELAQQEKVEHALKYPGYSYSPKGNSSKAQKSGTPSSFQNTLWTWTSTTTSTGSEVLATEVVPNESTSSIAPAVESNSGTEAEPDIPVFHHACLANENISQNPIFKPYLSPSSMLSTLPTISRSPRAIFDRTFETSSSSNEAGLWSFDEYEHYVSDLSLSSVHFPMSSTAANDFAGSCLSSMMDLEILNKALPHPSTFFRNEAHSSFFNKLGEITASTLSQRNDQWPDMNPDMLANMTSSYLNLED